MPPFLGSSWWALWVLPAGTALLLFCVWLWRGRDDRAHVPMPHNSWQPPMELSPAQVATLVDDSCDLRYIAATLVDLAARGFLFIEEVPANELVLARGDVRFVRSENAPPLERLKRHERLFLEALFDPQPPDIERDKRSANTALSNEPWNETALSLLQFKFYRHLPALEREIYASLMRQGFFFSDPGAVKAFFLSVGSVLLVLGLALLRGVIRGNEVAFTSGWISLPVGVLLSAAIWKWSARQMPAKTALGTLKADQARRFASWVRGVPLETLRPMLQKNPNLFERLLPYALVLGVGETWAKKCDGCGGWAPLWFVCHSQTQSAPDSVARLIDLLPRIERVLSSAPPRRQHESERDI